MAVESQNIYRALDERDHLAARQRSEVEAALTRAELAIDACLAAGRWVRAAVDWVVARWRDAAARAELASLTDRELADIGLSRSDIHRRDLGEIAREAAPAVPVAANSNEIPRRAA
jgi:uncharacterized protein YjiS (DUF1127 family)